jgi:hypothetical protein
MLQTFWAFFTSLRTLMGKQFPRERMMGWPAPMARAFFAARAARVSSFPSTRTRHSPEDSQKAGPNFAPGTDPTTASATRRASARRENHQVKSLVVRQRGKAPVAMSSTV